jgi:hypothetical protein
LFKTPDQTGKNQNQRVVWFVRGKDRRSKKLEKCDTNKVCCAGIEPPTDTQAQLLSVKAQYHLGYVIFAIYYY